MALPEEKFIQLFYQVSGINKSRALYTLRVRLLKIHKKHWNINWMSCRWQKGGGHKLCQCWNKFKNWSHSCLTKKLNANSYKGKLTNFWRFLQLSPLQTIPTNLHGKYCTAPGSFVFLLSLELTKMCNSWVHFFPLSALWNRKNSSPFVLSKSIFYFLRFSMESRTIWDARIKVTVPFSCLHFLSSPRWFFGQSSH